MQTKIVSYILKITLFLTFGLCSVVYAHSKIYGVHEKIKLMDFGNNVIVKAKLDTGAVTSSLGAKQIKLFKRNGHEWVSFIPQLKEYQLKTVELPLVRHSKIKRRQADIDQDERLHTVRPVVLMNLCFDGQIYPVEVNLTDRSRFIYPLLIGTSALKQFKAAVDPALKFRGQPSC